MVAVFHASWNRIGVAVAWCTLCLAITGGPAAAGERGTASRSHRNEFHNLAAMPDPAVHETMRRLQAKLHQYASGKAPTTPFNPLLL